MIYCHKFLGISVKKYSWFKEGELSVLKPVERMVHLNYDHPFMCPYLLLTVNNSKVKFNNMTKSVATGQKAT